MVVKLIEDKALWDKHIVESPYGTLFHSWDFLKIIERNSGCKLYPYGIYRGDELVCLFPLFIKRFMGIKMIFSPPPGLAIPYLGFVMSSAYDRIKQRRKESYINSVADEVNAEIKKLNVNFVYMLTVNRFVDVRPFQWNGYSVRMNYSYAIDLRRPLGDIRGDFDGQLERGVSESEKLPLALRPTDNVDQFYRVMLDRFNGLHETPPIMSREYLADILRSFPDNIKIGFVCRGDDILDPVATYQYKKRSGFLVWLARPDEASHGSEYCAWNLIKDKKAEGMESLEMAGASVKGQYDFVSRFNAPLVYNYSVFRNDLIGRMGKGMYSSLVRIRI